MGKWGGKHMIRNQKGITLIALVVTIIVMLIIAGITVAMLTNNNGIILESRKAREQNTVGEEKEKIRASYSAVKMNLMKNADGKDHTVTAEALQNQLKYDLHLEEGKQVTVTGVTSSEISESKETGNPNREIKEGSLKVTMPDSNNVYVVDTDGRTELLSYMLGNS